MEYPIVVMERDGLVVVRQNEKHLVLHINPDGYQNNLTCNFLNGKQDLYAAVAAPEQHAAQLARRIVSFLSAYLRVDDPVRFEREILGCIPRHGGK
jgi:hypothetical protein